MCKGGGGLRRTQAAAGVSITLRDDLQNGEFARLKREDWEQEEADQEAHRSTQVTGGENEHSIPSTH